jgi:tRNA(Ile)-lysidine synthase
VAVSGGADSVALALALRECPNLGPLTIAHVNHQLRGTESDQDQQFVVELARQLTCDIRVEAIDVAARAAKNRANLEATARQLRYQWFDQLAEECQASWIATGHTANDQAETVLHRIIRGTGLQGLRGIAPQRGRILRPMLAVTRNEILDFLQERHQPYRTDSSNADPRFTRNRIRAELLPLLESFNPNIIRGLGRLASQAEDVFAEQHELAQKVLLQAERPRAGTILVFDWKRLAAETDDAIRLVFRAVWEREGWPIDAMSLDHWQRLVEIVREKQPAVDFPAGVRVCRVGPVIQCERR